jgi:cellulose synthase/poly-beta-1,6-N-acetylglucosamine synthase-like glycosyltransferase
MEIVFLLSFIFVAYVYLGYPALLAVARRVARRPVAKVYWEPSVSIVIAAHNERERLDNKLQNCLSLDYPKEKLQIIVSLDGSTDGSEFVLRRFLPHGITVVQSRSHRGKPGALNSAMRRAKGEIVVFADARQTFHSAVIRELVANFADAQVGAVSGELILTEPSNREAVTDVGLYWRYEKVIRSMESDIHSLPGATGAIYAIRRELYRRIPEDTLIDDVLIPMRIVLQGKRAVFDPSAKAYDAVACCPNAEFGRKVRTLAGNYQLLTREPEVLLPWRNPIFFQFVSHKVGRLLVPYALIALYVSNLFMPRGIFLLTLLLQTLWYGFAAAGYMQTKPLESRAAREVGSGDTAEIVAPIFSEKKRAA